MCASRVLSDHRNTEANEHEHSVDSSQLNESTVVSVHNESSLVVGDVTVDTVHIHIR